MWLKFSPMGLKFSPKWLKMSIITDKIKNVHYNGHFLFYNISAVTSAFMFIKSVILYVLLTLP